jgi:drug/metabolite transporter (DMT)-like permease
MRQISDLSAALRALLAMVMVGSSVAAASLLTAYPVLTGQAARYATAAAVLWVFTRARGRRLPPLTRRDAGWLVAVALFGLSGFNYVLIEATARVDPSIVGAVLGATPIALAILGPLQDRRPIAARTVGAAVAVTAGVVLVQRAAGPLDPIGLALALLVLVGEAGFALFAVPPLRRIGPVGVSFHATWIGAVQLALGALVLERGVLRLPTLTEAAALAHMALLVTVVAFVAWYGAISRLDADRAGLFLGLVPVTALITSALVGTTTVTAATAGGSIIVAIAVTIGATQAGDRDWLAVFCHPHKRMSQYHSARLLLRQVLTRRTAATPPPAVGDRSIHHPPTTQRT